jgi:Formate hydrogenlyase subunit 6/NADH:ubiquinone oxidoreductase 23 kD subunit (chain I)
MTKIAFFSGTGNSLDVAKRLASKIENSELVSIMGILKSNNYAETAEKIVLVYPTYLMTIPLPVREYLRRTDIQNARYIAAITTCENKGNLSYLTIDKLLNKSGKKLSYYQEVSMPQNSPTGIRPTKGNADWIEKISGASVQEMCKRNDIDVSRISDDITNAVTFLPKRNIGKYLLESAISALSKNNKTQLQYYTDTTCTLCGLCARICPAERISIIDEKVVWAKDRKCYYCFACFNACPQQAILLKNYQKKDGRYIHPNTELEEIINQKCTRQ